MSRSAEEHRPLVPSSHSEPTPAELGYTQISQGNDNTNEDEEASDDDNGLTVSGHFISDKQNTTSCETMIHLIKGNVGTGILALPDGIKHAGLITGTIALPIISAICIHCMHLLVKSASELKMRLDLGSLDYADVGYHAFASGPERLQKLAPVTRTILNIFITITQLGFCCVYIVFVSASMKQVVECNMPGNDIDVHIYMAVLFLPLLSFAMIRSLKVLAPFSMISNICLGSGLAITFYYLLRGHIPSTQSRPGFKSWKELPLFFGISSYTFEGIAVVLPLEGSMQHPEDFRGCNGVLNSAMILVTCGYLAVAFFGYRKYGDDVKGSITLNLPPGDILAQLAKILIALAIFFTYTLMLYVPVEIMWPQLRTRFHSAKAKRIGERVFRSFLVLITFSLAAAIPNIGLFISLVGALSSSTVAMIFPPIIELVTFWPSLSKLSVAKCVCIALIGVVICITGTYASLMGIVDYFKNSHEPEPEPLC